MKKVFFLFASFVFMISGGVFAEEYNDGDVLNEAEYEDDDNIPYLDDDDIAAIEMILPEDVPDEYPKTVAEEEPGNVEENEMPRLNTSQRLYHLLILDRVRSPNSDIAGLENMEVLYKYRHGRDGYLIAVYVSSGEGPVFPVLPANSSVLVDLMSVRRATLREYVNSAAFRRFVTSSRITSDIQRVLR